MYSASSNMQATLKDFHVKGMMLRYSVFVPKLYNFCKSLGFEPGKIMPSRAFCSDESQGFPIILLAKHFGTFPFNHGVVGGLLAADRHGPHASHGKDMLIVQASHVGYDPLTGEFGRYRRLQCTDHDMSHNCGKIGAVLGWYLTEYEYACASIFLHRVDGQCMMTVDNQLLNTERAEGLFLNLAKLITTDAEGNYTATRSLSTAKCFHAAEEFVARLGEKAWPAQGREVIGARLTPDLFRFKRQIKNDYEEACLESNLLQPMPWIVTAESPLLAAAKVSTQVEFDRTFRTLVKEHSYQGKKLVYIAGLNIDISPEPGQLFPLTKFVPWAAYVQREDGSYYTLEQSDLMARLNEQAGDNPDQIDLEAAIRQMRDTQEIKVRVSS